MDLKLDNAGITEMLKSGDVASAIHSAAEAIAGGVDKDAEIVVDDYTTDRAASSVTIRDVRALAWQAKYGTLTRAASGAGLEVKSR